MLTNWDRVQMRYREQQREDRFAPYSGVLYWRRRARFYRALCLLLLVILLLLVRK